MTPPVPAGALPPMLPRTPAWTLAAQRVEDVLVDVQDLGGVTADWAWGGSQGRGIRVCLLDSGIEAGHPLVGPVHGSYATVRTAAGVTVEPVAAGDLSGHGTACAGVVREAAPECELYSVRVLDQDFSGTGEMLLVGLRWAVEQRFDVVSLSLSTTRALFRPHLQEITDDAHHLGVVVVAAAHNAAVASYPWRFSSLVSVAAHAFADDDLVLLNPEPPVDFFAKGTNVRVPWLAGTTKRSTGNSFAAPRVAGLAARILAKHPLLTVYQLKTVLALTAANARPRR